MWDLAQSEDSKRLIERSLADGKPLGVVCDAPGVLPHVVNAGGEPLVKGKLVTGFFNTEEEAVGLKAVVPFLVEDMIRSLGGRFSQGAPWSSHVVTDSLLVSGQNPQSPAEAARALLTAMARTRAAPAKTTSAQALLGQR